MGNLQRLNQLYEFKFRLLLYMFVFFFFKIKKVIPWEGNMSVKSPRKQRWENDKLFCMTKSKLRTESGQGRIG